MNPALILLFAIPAGAAAILAAIPDYRISSRINVLASALTLIAGVSLFWMSGYTDDFLLLDDLNIVFIVLNSFVGFTASVFSATYIAHEVQTGRLTPGYLRFYHAMYQAMMFGMNLALVANNIGLMWVAIELATLATVLMV